MYEIEDNIPPKEYQRPRPAVYATFDKMEVGQSFKVPKADYNKVRKAAERYSKEHGGKVTFKCGSIGDGTYRVWRTA